MALMDSIKKFFGMVERAPFDPSVFGDPLALQISWAPAKYGGTNFGTYRFVSVDSGRAEFRGTWGAIVLYSIFLLIGVGLLVACVSTIYSVGRLFFSPEVIGLSFGGLLFSGVGIALVIFGTTPVIFDKARGFFWKGRKLPDEALDKSCLKDFAILKDIHALQLVSEYCSGSKSSFYSYELNLVLKNCERITVIDHGNLKMLRADAAALGRFLGKPVWDGIR